MQGQMIDLSGLHEAQKASGLDCSKGQGVDEYLREESGFHAVVDHIMEVEIF